MAEVRRRKGESFESLLRRFSRRMQLSGKTLQTRKIRFYTGEPTKRQLRSSALHRAKTRAKREWMLKTGLVTEEELREEQKSRRRH